MMLNISFKRQKICHGLPSHINSEIFDILPYKYMAFLNCSCTVKPTVIHKTFERNSSFHVKYSFVTNCRREEEGGWGGVGG